MKLIKMNQEEFELIKGKMIADYTKEKVKLGIWAEEEALELAKETFNTMLKDGVDTKNNFFYNIVNENVDRIAYVWFAKPENEAFIYNVDIFEAYKEKVDLKEIYTLIEDAIFSLRATKISIHSFGYNKELIDRYKTYGFDIIDVTLSKKL